MLMTRFLRVVLFADAGATAATGLLAATGSTMLQAHLGLPAPLLLYSGIALLPYAAGVAYVAAQSQISRGSVWIIVAANAAWAVDSLILLVLGWVHPTPLAYAFVIGQALVVAVFCELQLIGLRRASGVTLAAA